VAAQGSCFSALVSIMDCSIGNTALKILSLSYAKWHYTSRYLLLLLAKAI